MNKKLQFSANELVLQLYFKNVRIIDEISNFKKTYFHPKIYLLLMESRYTTNDINLKRKTNQAQRKVG